MKNRIAHIDIAKGISIVLVALFHSHVKLFIPEIIDSMSLFRVPLFFFLSGVFFSSSIKAGGFLIKKSEGLLKPYFSVLLLIFLIDAFFLYRENLMQELIGIFYGNGDTIRWVPLWFIPHLFAVHCFAYIVFKHFNFDRYYSYIKWIVLVILLSVGALSIDLFWLLDITFSNHTITLPGLPFSIDIILITSTYFIIGHILRNKIIDFTPSIILLLLSFIIFLCIALFTDTHTDLNYRVYSNPILASLGAACGIYITLYFSYLIANYKSVKNIFITLGKGSLYILIFHSYIGDKLYINISELMGNRDYLLLAILIFLLSISLPLLIKWIVEGSSILSLFFLPFKNNRLLNSIRHKHY